MGRFRLAGVQAWRDTDWDEEFEIGEPVSTLRPAGL